MRSICYLLLISAMPLLKVEASLAQELSVEDRACITGAVAKLPQVAALKIEGSRAIEGRACPASAGNPNPFGFPFRKQADAKVGTASGEREYT
jgi:hypothetical protein